MCLALAHFSTRPCFPCAIFSEKNKKKKKNTYIFVVRLLVCSGAVEQASCVCSDDGGGAMCPYGSIGYYCSCYTQQGCRRFELITYTQTHAQMYDWRGWGRGIEGVGWVTHTHTHIVHHPNWQNQQWAERKRDREVLEWLHICYRIRPTQTFGLAERVLCTHIDGYRILERKKDGALKQILFRGMWLLPLCVCVFVCVRGVCSEQTEKGYIWGNMAKSAEVLWYGDVRRTYDTYDALHTIKPIFLHLSFIVS